MVTAPLKLKTVSFTNIHHLVNSLKYTADTRLLFWLSHLLQNRNVVNGRLKQPHKYLDILNFQTDILLHKTQLLIICYVNQNCVYHINYL